MLSKTKSRLDGKTFLQIFLFFLLLPQLCFTQWYLQTSGTAANLNSVHFENANNGWTVGASGTILHTTNGGQEWLTQASGTSNNLNEVWFTDLNTGWVVGDSGKILKTITGGQEWIEQTSGTNFHLNSVCFTDMNKGWVVGEGIILHTNDGGTAWVEQSNDTLQPSSNSICFVDSNTGWTGGILKTTDGGNNWINPSPQYGWDYVSTLFFLDLNKGWISVYAVGCTNGRINYTTNGGTDWIYVAESINANSIYFIDSNNGWAVGFDSPGCFFNMFKSIDGGLNWISQPNVTSEWLNSVYFTDLNNGWAVGSNGTILHTTNGGIPVELTSFTATVNNKEVILNWSTATELNNQGFEIERASSKTSPRQEDWEKIGFVPGFGTTAEPKSYIYSDQLINSGTFYYRLKQVDYDGSYEYSGVVEVKFSAVNLYLLEQNYPNPFNPTTTIGFGIQDKSNVKITVLNSIGEEVAVVLNEQREPGFHQVEFIAVNLPSGVYFYQLKAGDFIQTRKMILLK